MIADDGKVAAKLDVDLDSGRWTISNASDDVIASGTQDLVRVGIHGLSPDGTAAIYSDYRGGRTRYWRTSLTGGQPSELWQQTAVDRLIYRPLSSRIDGIRLRDGSRRRVSRCR
ncbi:hypothetical protein PF049_10555 [Erythrobacteraceae bacterium WH01K]|nr:hypothetical protein PF049_10555 [Erythrobacteraceae bacterium WH01K]